MTHALLIDGENTSSARAAAILDLVPADCVVRRVYGDARHLDGWGEVPWACIRHVASGRAGIDFAIIIDAVTLAYGKGCRTFTLVSAESDFALVVSHLREHGCTIRVLPAPAATPDQLDAVTSGRAVLRVVASFGQRSMTAGTSRTGLAPQEHAWPRPRLVESALPCPADPSAEAPDTPARVLLQA